MWAALLACALSAWLQELAGIDRGNGRGRRTISRLRQELINVPARLARRAGTTWLHLPPGEQLLATVLPRLQQLPRPGYHSPSSNSCYRTISGCGRNPRPAGATTGHPSCPPRPHDTEVVSLGNRSPHRAASRSSEEPAGVSATGARRSEGSEGRRVRPAGAKRAGTGSYHTQIVEGGPARLEQAGMVGCDDGQQQLSASQRVGRLPPLPQHGQALAPAVMESWRQELRGGRRPPGSARSSRYPVVRRTKIAHVRVPHALGRAGIRPAKLPRSSAARSCQMRSGRRWRGSAN